MTNNLKNLAFSLIITMLVVSGCNWIESNLLNSENDFQNILMPAKETKKGDYGFVNIDGEIIIDFDLDIKNTPSIMNEGVAYYQDRERDNKISFIYNNQGKAEIKETNYIETLLFNEGLALAVEEMGSLVYINKKLNEELVLDKDIQQAGNFSEGLAKFQNDKGKWGFIDKTGKKVIQAEYDNVKSFSEGYAVVEILVEDEEEGNFWKRGVINQQGKVIIKLRDKYSYIGDFHEGLAVFTEDDEKGYINPQGKEVIKDKDWQDLQTFKNGYATVMEDNQWGLINNQGEKIINTRYNYPLYINNGLIGIYQDNKWGFINLDREEIIDFDYNRALPFFGKGAYVKDGKYWIFINKKEMQQGDLELTELVIPNFGGMFGSFGDPNKANIIGLDRTINSQYVAIDELFKSTIEVFYNKFALKKTVNWKVKDAVKNIEKLIKKYSSENASDSLENKLDIYSSQISSYQILDQNYFQYNNDLSFAVYYNFDKPVGKNITKKIDHGYWTEEKVIGKETNSEAKLIDFGFYIGLNGNAYKKGDFVKEKVLQYFKKQGFKQENDFDYQENKQLEMSSKNMTLNYYQNESACVILINPKEN